MQKIGRFLLLFSLLCWGLAHAEPAPRTVIMHSAASGATAAGNVLDVTGYATVGLQVLIASAWDGTLTFGVSNDGTNYVGLLCRTSTTAALSLTTAAANAAITCPVGGFRYFQAPVSARSTGSVTVTATMIAAPMLAQAPLATGLGTFTSAQLATALSDEIGTPGFSVFSISPTLTGTTTVAALQAGTTAAQFGPLLSARGTRNNIEFGHTNGSGYGSAFGGEPTSGKPFLCLNCSASDTADTYRTYGIAGVLIRTDAAGALLVDSITTTTGDALSPTNRMSIAATGGVTFTDLATTGAATGKTLVCADTAGRLYRSTSAVTCAN